ncbi:MAG: LysR family transcriptional regulator [Oscillospiraceae bacterium]
MTLYEIEAFLSVAANGTLTKAADSLHITQSALSRRLRALEDQLGYCVITRNKGRHQVTITERGQAFVPIALDWMALWNKTKALSTDSPRRTLRVAAADGPNIYVLTPVYKQFLKNHPDVDLDIRTEHSAEAYSDIEKGTLDIAIAATAQYSDQAVTMPAYKEKMLFACNKSATYPTPVHPNDLDAQKYIYCARHLEFQLWFEGWFGSSNSPEIKCDLIPLMQAFLSRQSWTIIPASIAKTLLGDPEITFIPMESAPPDRILYAVYIPSLGGRNPLAIDFLRLLDAHLRHNFDASVTSLIDFEAPPIILPD